MYTVSPVTHQMLKAQMV